MVRGSVRRRYAKPYEDLHGRLQDIGCHQRSSAGDLVLESSWQEEASIEKEPGLVDFHPPQTHFPTGIRLLVLLPADVIFSAVCEFHIRV